MKIMYSKLNYVLERYLDIIAILFLISNFVIWNINDEILLTINFQLYHYFVTFILVAVILNVKKINILQFLTENIFFLLIVLLLIYNSYYIEIFFNGTYVDMGLRSRKLIETSMPSFFLILMMYRYVNKRAFIVAFASVVSIILFYSIIAVNGFLSEDSYFMGINIIYKINRYNSILNNPNTLGIYTFIGLFILFLFLLICKNKLVRFLILLLSVIIFAASILSGSRSAFLMIIILYLIINLYYAFYEKSLKYTLLLVNIFVGVIFLYAYNGGTQSIIDSIRTEFSLSGRDEIWDYLVTVIKEHWQYGIGYHNSTYVMNESNLFDKLTSPHNMYIGTFVEMGILPFIMTIIWFPYLIISNHNIITVLRNNKNIKYLIAFNAFYISFLLGQYFEYSFLKMSTLNTVLLCIIAFNYKIKAEILNKKDCCSFISYIYVISIISVFIYGNLTNLEPFITVFLSLVVTLIFIVIRSILNSFLKKR